MLAFLAVMSLFLGGLGLYLGNRLIPATWSGQARTLAWVTLVVAIALQPLSFLLMRFVRSERSEMVVWLAFSVMGLFLLTLSFSLLRDVGWLGARLTGTLPTDPGRRATLLGFTNAGVLSVAGAMFALGVARTRMRPVVVEVTVPIRDLPPELEGFSIAQISDVHVGNTITRDFVASVVAQVNALEVDLVAVTGDIVDGLVSSLQQHTAPLGDLKARHGVFFVTGNHEYYSGVHPWLEEMTRLGMRVLNNAHEVIERAGHKLVVAGVTDLMAHQTVPEHKSDPQQAMAGAPDAAFKLLLAHQPRSAYAAQKAGFHLQLSGHTHAGQFFPATVLVYLVQPFVQGLHRHEDMWVYTNRGTGYWGPPLRHGEGGEITRLKLTRAADEPAAI